MKSYIQSTAEHTGAATVYHQFTILFNVGFEFVYPDCSPWCLFDPNNGSPLELTNQMPNREYYSTTASSCWRALSDCQNCLNSNPLSTNPASDGSIFACSTIQCTASSSITYTPPSSALIFSTDTSQASYSIPISTFSDTLSPSTIAPLSVYQIWDGLYVAPPWDIFTLGSTTLDINTGSGQTFTSEQLYLKFKHTCVTYQSEVAAWDPQEDFETASGPAAQYVPFQLTIANGPNC